MDETLKFSKMLSTDTFYKAVDALVDSHNLSYIDAVVYYCERNNVEIEVAASMIKNNFRRLDHHAQGAAAVPAV